MTAAESLPEPGRPPFADASPAQVRAALTSDAEQRIRTGERHPDAAPWSQLKAELGLAE